MGARIPFRVACATLDPDGPVAPVRFGAEDASDAGGDLDDHAVHLRQWRIDDVPADLHGALDSRERARADRFLVEPARRQFVAAHAGLRALLAGYLDRDPAALRFRVTDRGKPFLEDDGCTGALRFNLSHSGDWILCGIARHREIGVDVEVMAKRVYRDQIARRNYHPREQEALRRATRPLDHALFYRFWTLKEAAIKALGVGLYANLQSLDFSDAVDGDAGGPLPIENVAWRWCAWSADEDVAAAAVWEVR